MHRSHHSAEREKYTGEVSGRMSSGNRGHESEIWRFRTLEVRKQLKSDNGKAQLAIIEEDR
ncbi:hypothetical protein ACTXT7_006693 [Hymenolepis weldensis]